LNSYILIVDDDPDILAAARLVLECAGYDVRSAANGTEALSLLHQESAPCRLILLDLMMPVMNGWEFRAEQVRDPSLSAIPVVIMTGAGHAALRASPVGAADLLEKPVDLGTLLSTVRRYDKTTAAELH
jgi:CheY-like chemotaxis protein